MPAEPVQWGTKTADYACSGAVCRLGSSPNADHSSMACWLVSMTHSLAALLTCNHTTCCSYASSAAFSYPPPICAPACYMVPTEQTPQQQQRAYAGFVAGHCEPHLSAMLLSPTLAGLS